MTVIHRQQILAVIKKTRGQIPAVVANEVIAVVERIIADLTTADAVRVRDMRRFISESLRLEGATSC